MYFSCGLFWLKEKFHGLLLLATGKKIKKEKEDYPGINGKYTTTFNEMPIRWNLLWVTCKKRKKFSHVHYYVI